MILAICVFKIQLIFIEIS